MRGKVQTDDTPRFMAREQDLQRRTADGPILPP